MTSPAGGGQYQQDVGAPGGPHGPKITSIFDFSAEALEQIAFWLEQRGLHIPVTQLLGFSQFTANVAPPIATGQATSSVTYTDLATVGPTLTGLSDGKYLVWFGGAGSTNSIMGVQGNSTAIADDNSSAAGVALSFATSLTLSNHGNNTLTAKYRSSDGTPASFSRRWMVVLKYANP